VSSSWTRQDRSLVLNVTLPFNSQTKVHIPKMGLEKVMVKEGKKTIWENGSYIGDATGIRSGSEDEEYTELIKELEINVKTRKDGIFEVLDKNGNIPCYDENKDLIYRKVGKNE